MDYRFLDDRVNLAIKIMERSGGPARVTEAKLAASANLSVFRFAHLFRQQTGMAPLKMLRAIRLRRSARLLAETRLSVKEIAWQVGFRTCAGFVRAFGKTFGVTPTECRRKRLELASAAPSGIAKTMAAGVGLGLMRGFEE
jgi:AraC family transcriptional regulator of arabinose operon